MLADSGHIPGILSSLQRWRAGSILVALLLGLGVASCDTISLSDAPPAILMKVYGGAKDEIGRSVVVAPDGGYYILGSTKSFGAGDYDFYLVRTDASGIELWSRTYGGSNSDSGRSIIATSDGGYLLVGSTYSFGPGLGDIYAVRIDPLGDTLWTRSYGGPNFEMASAAIEADGGYIIAGTTQGFNSLERDFYAAKIDRQGGLLWQRSYAGSDDDFCTGIVPSREGYFLSGTHGLDPATQTAYYFRIDSAGEPIDGKSVFNPKGASNAAWMLNDSSMIFFGSSRVTPAAEDSMMILRAGLRGTPSYKNFGGGGSSAHSAIETTDGGYALLGYSKGFGRGSDMFLVRTNADGRLLWSRSFGGERDDEGHALMQTRDGGFLLVGTTRSVVRGTNGSDILLIRTNASGELVE